MATTPSSRPSHATAAALCSLSPHSGAVVSIGTPGCIRNVRNGVPTSCPDGLVMAATVVRVKQLTFVLSSASLLTYGGRTAKRC